ncbi:MAG: hypothetical protein HY080_01645 [Gammaproteobacteria bacterium]|nr:hypothetical protein [Gammaproteobacteria bacterium]
MDSTLELPSIIKSPYSPSIKELGVLLVFSEKESSQKKKIIQGVFALPKHQDVKVNGPPHKAIVVTINFDGRYVVVKPFEDIIALGGDVEETKTAYVGYFQFDMYDYFEYTTAGIYYVVSSLGIYLSNILQVSID